MTHLTTSPPATEPDGSPPPRLGDLVISEDGQAFDRKTGRSYRVNPTGRFVLQLAQAGRLAPEVAGELAARYAQHPAVAAAALDAFYSQVARYLP